MRKIFLAFFLAFCLSGNSQSIFTVYFDFNSFELTAEARKTIDSLLDNVGKTGNQAGVTLNGFCDAIGSHAYNDQLSIKRVNAVKKYVLDNSNPGLQLLKLSGFGKRKPVNDNASPAARQLNRKVDIILNSASLTQNSTGTLKDRILDTSISRGSMLVLKNINFHGGRHQWLPESQPVVDELLQTMKSLSTLVIEIHGHICCQPTTDDGRDAETGQYNLSEARARAIRNYLVNNGIEPSRVSYRGIGHFNPIYPYPEKSPEEATANRRVEIKIISK